MDDTTLYNSAMVWEPTFNITMTRSTNNTSRDGMNNEDIERESKVIITTATAVFAVLLITGLVVNLIVMFVTIATNRSSKHPIHSIFVMNMAISDVIFLVTSGPYWFIILAVPGWKYGAFLCSFFPFVTTTTVCSSIFTICTLAWIRFMALVMPFRFRRSCMSTRKAGYITLIPIWIAGCLLSMPYLFMYGLRTGNSNGNGTVYYCDWLESQNTTQVKKAHAIAKLTMIYLIPLVLVIFFYSVIGREVFCYMMHRRTSMERGRTAEQKECMKSAIVMMSLITAFLVCWSPHLVETMIMLTGYNEGEQHWKQALIIEIVGKAMSYTHAIINPIIYTLASPIFRNSLRSSIRDQVRSCRKGSLFTRYKSNGNQSRNVNDKNSKAPPNKSSGQAIPLTTMKEEPAARNAEQLRIYGADSHITEVSRLSPDMSHTERKAKAPRDGLNETDCFISPN